MKDKIFFKFFKLLENLFFGSVFGLLPEAYAPFDPIVDVEI